MCGVRGSEQCNGDQRSALSSEIDAHRVTDKAKLELGQAPEFHAPNGAYLGDDAVLRGIGGDYGNAREVTLLGLPVVGSIGVGGTVAAVSIAQSRD